MKKINMCLADVLVDVSQTRIALISHTNEIDGIIGWFLQRNIHFSLLPEVTELVTYAYTLKQRLLT